MKSIGIQIIYSKWIKMAVSSAEIPSPTCKWAALCVPWDPNNSTHLSHVTHAMSAYQAKQWRWIQVPKSPQISKKHNRSLVQLLWLDSPSVPSLDASSKCKKGHLQRFWVPPTVTYSKKASRCRGGARLHHSHMGMARQGILLSKYFGIIEEDLWLIHHAV